MILGILGAGILSETVKFGRSIFLEEKAIKKYLEAYGKSAESEKLVYDKSIIVDNKLQAVLNKKKAIRNYTIPMYINIYEQIKDIEREGSKFLDIENYEKKIQKVSTLNYMKESTKSSYSDKELLLGTLTFGMGTMAIKSSKKMISDANVQMSYANVQYSEAKTIIMVLDAIEEQAIRVSKVLALLNMLTVRLLSNIEPIVNRNGNYADNYTNYELELLTLCENMVIGLVDLLNIPVINKDGIVEMSARQLIKDAEKNVKKFELLLNKEQV